MDVVDSNSGDRVWINRSMVQQCLPQDCGVDVDQEWFKATVVDASDGMLAVDAGLELSFAVSSDDVLHAATSPEEGNISPLPQ
jgi:hypothetical protein